MKDDDLLETASQNFKKDLQRVPGITQEFLKGFYFFRNKHNIVTVFGSARLTEESPWYQTATKMGSLLADSGISVMTGGGPGIMEAVNRGAFTTNKNVLSIGVNIELEHEQHPNPYLTHTIHFNHFFARKVMLVKYSFGFVIFPGGFGTLDELAETITLIQTQKLHNFPLVLVGKKFWGGFYDWVQQTMLLEKVISQQDLDLIHLCDTPEEALDHIRAFKP